MDDSRLNRLVGATLLSFFAGAASFLASLFVLSAIAVWTGLLPIVLFGPEPKGVARAMFALYGSAAFIAGAAAWVTFRFIKKH